MQNRKIERIVKRAKKQNKISNQEINYIRSDLKVAIKRIRNIIKENPKITPEELRQEVLYDIFLEVEEHCKISHFKGMYYQLEAAKKIVTNKDIIDKEWDFIDITRDSNDQQPIYGGNLKISCRTLIHQVIKEIDRRNKEMSPEVKKVIEEYNNSDAKNKKKIEQQFKDKKVIEDFRDLASEYMGSEKDRVYTTIKNSLDYFEEQLKNMQIQTMEFIGEKLDENGLLERYKENSDNNMVKCGMKGYTYDVSTQKHKKDEIGIKEVFSREFLETQDAEEVMLLSLFWQNRYAKETESIGNAIFTIDTLNLWGEIVKGKEDIKITDDQISAVVNKMICLREIVSSHMNNLKGKSKKTTKEDLDRGYKKVDGTEEIKNIVKQEGKNYKAIYDEHLPSSSNNLERDIELYNILLNQNENIYMIRNALLGCKVRSLFDSKKCKNWGIIPEEFKQYENDENVKSKYVLIGIDQEGFNMPIRLHIKKSLLIDFIKSYNGDTKIPIYEGDRDFIIHHSLIKANVLMPMQKAQKTIINKKYKESSEKRMYNSDMIEHLRFLKDSDKYPEHLKIEIITPTGKKKVRPSRKYMDLSTGDIFEKINNEYVKIEKEKGKSFDGR